MKSSQFTRQDTRPPASTEARSEYIVGRRFAAAKFEIVVAWALLTEWGKT